MLALAALTACKRLTPPHPNPNLLPKRLQVHSPPHLLPHRIFETKNVIFFGDPFKNYLAIFSVEGVIPPPQNVKKILIFSKERLKLWAKYSEPQNKLPDSFFLWELQELEVRIYVHSNFPIIILILLNGFSKFVISMGPNTRIVQSL